jgi:pimeloyl-ACP methyl ester carboxylesterase
MSYMTHSPLAQVIRDIYDRIPDDDCYIVGHSLGGLIAVAASQLADHRKEKKIKKILTISSPFGGCKGADYLKWFFPTHRLFSEISTVSPVIQTVNAIGAVVPTKCLVTNHGSIPLINGENDGVVSVESQMALKGAEFAKQSNNHFEVLLSEDTVAMITEYFALK